MRRGIAWVASSHEEADVTDLARLLKMGDCVRPTHIINCAAMTDVDKAEKQPERAFEVNAAGAKNVALTALELGAGLIHLSTDYVFDGLLNRPYKEEDPCRALNIFGQSKLGGEQLVRETMGEACILRTSWVFGIGGSDHCCQLVEQFSKEETLQVPVDQIGSPTYVNDLAETILDILGKSGTYHFSNLGSLSYFQIANDLHQALLERQLPIKCKEIKPTGSIQLPEMAKRPFYSTLDTSEITRVLGKQPREWKQVLRDFVGEL